MNPENHPAPTPETDCECERDGLVPAVVKSDFARKLERERDDARLLNSAQGEYDIVAERDQLRKELTAALALTNINVESELLKRTEERDQLRKVADELAACAKHIGCWSAELGDVIDRARLAIEDYEELPHVKL